MDHSLQICLRKIVISFLLHLNVVLDSLYLKEIPTMDRDVGMYCIVKVEVKSEVQY